jgi:hypothetical protein
MNKIYINKIILLIINDRIEEVLRYPIKRRFSIFVVEFGIIIPLMTLFVARIQQVLEMLDISVALLDLKISIQKVFQLKT